MAEGEKNEGDVSSQHRQLIKPCPGFLAFSTFPIFFWLPWFPLYYRKPTMTRLARLLLLSGFLGLLLIQTPLRGQEVPSPTQILGYELGERFTPVAGISHYFSALAEASDRVSVHPYGKSVEGRPLLQVLVATPAQRARLEEILELNRELTHPETSQNRADEIIRANPAVVYLSYGVHGNEASSSEAAMWTAFDLARGAPDVARVLDSVVVIIEPMVNPDGRDRYVNFYRQARGLNPNPDRTTREHQEPWPGGRPNHYLFDLNRDWAWMSQPETRARLATWGRWNPQVQVDFHEMGSNSSYFFFPAAKPINPIFPEHILEWGRRIGEGNARAFDEKGWLYYTAQGFDLFYPGYGDSWPSLLGGIGMTYEQAGGGGAGLVIERTDGTMLTLKDRASHHWVAGIATVRTAAEGKTDLLQGFAAFHRNVDEGLQDILLVPGQDPARVRALVRHLQNQGIQIERAKDDFRAQAEAHKGFGSREAFPAGTYLVRARQPRGRLAGALLKPEFLLEGSSTYDITAWSLPYAYGVEAHSVMGESRGSWVVVGELPKGNTAEVASSPYGYLLTPGFRAMPGLVDFLEAGGRAYAQPDTFRLAGTLYPQGTLFLPKGRNEELGTRVSDAGLAPYLVPVNTGLTETGLDLGTGSAGFVTLPKVGVVAGEGVSSTSYGAHWFFLEQTLGLPFDAINLSSLGNIELTDFDVLVFPEGRGMQGVMGDRGSEALEAWVRAGGTLVAVGSSAEALGLDLGELKLRRADEEELEKDEELAKALRTREEREDDRWAQAVPGTILKVSLDPRHPLAAGGSADGLTNEMFVLSRGRAFEPSDGFESVAFFPQDLGRISGVITEESLDRLGQSTWLAQVGVGRGSLILFVEDPLFRMFWYSGFQLYANALLMGPAF